MVYPSRSLIEVFLKKKISLEIEVRNVYKHQCKKVRWTAKVDSMNMWEYVEENYLSEVGILKNLKLSKEIKILGIEDTAKKFKVLYDLKQLEKIHLI